MDVEEGGWIQAFSGVTSLEIRVHKGGRHLNLFSLTPFHNFSPALKSLRVGPTLFQYPRFFDLVRHQLLDLPNGLHFRHIALSWDLVDDVKWVTELVALCSHSLESLDITHNYRNMPIRIWSTPIT